MAFHLSPPRLACGLDVKYSVKGRTVRREVRREAAAALKEAGFKTRYEFPKTEKGRKAAEAQADKMRPIVSPFEEAGAFVHVYEFMMMGF